MASNINPNNIDGTYPVAGQDNDSQGFRDNFTNIKTNFQIAEDEITDLQNNAILKTALAGTTLDNNMGGSLLYNYQSQDVAETVVSLGTTSGTVTLDYASGPVQTVTTSGNISLAFTNFPTAGLAGRIRLRVTVASFAHTLTLPAAVSVGTFNVQGISGQVISFNNTGTFEFEFETTDGGTTISIFDLNRNRDPIYLPSAEDVANAASIDLDTTSSYFSTGGSGETATLGDGLQGQIKILYMAGDGGGNMVVTVTNAGWGGAGTLTFGDVGDGCTLIFDGNYWWVVGNNGVAIA